MHQIEQIYIDGQFVSPRGTEWADLHNPATESVIGKVRLGNVDDTRIAIAAAKRAFAGWSRTTIAERVAVLTRMAQAVAAHRAQHIKAMQEEYGAPQLFASMIADACSKAFLEAIASIEHYPFERPMGNSSLIMQPIGVVAAITPWNADAFFICSKLATALAAGCTIVIKPSELSALQTQMLLQALHQAEAPAGIFNIVNGRGEVVGAELSCHPDIAKISFTGSTRVGRLIMTAAAQSMKRVTLELGGKGAQLVLDDADLNQAVPILLANGFGNSGQACIAGTRILVSTRRQDELLHKLQAATAAIKTGAPGDPTVTVGPLVNRSQWERVQNFIRTGVAEGAKLLIGGEGRPEGLDSGWFIKPTIFSHVHNQMQIAREEIFGPVLSVISYHTEAEAIAIANDTHYGLQSYVLAGDIDHARHVAAQLDAGRVQINGAWPDANVPFGGFKQSGIGRERGVFGLEAHLEAKAVVG